MRFTPILWFTTVSVWDSPTLHTLDIGHVVLAFSPYLSRLQEPFPFLPAIFVGHAPKSGKLQCLKITELPSDHLGQIGGLGWARFSHYFPDDVGKTIVYKERIGDSDRFLERKFRLGGVIRLNGYKSDSDTVLIPNPTLRLDYKATQLLRGAAEQGKKEYRQRGKEKPNDRGQVENQESLSVNADINDSDTRSVTLIRTTSSW